MFLEIGLGSGLAPVVGVEPWSPVEPRANVLVDLVRFELTTSSMPWKRAPNCATGPREEFFSHYIMPVSLTWSRRSESDGSTKSLGSSLRVHQIG